MTTQRIPLTVKLLLIAFLGITLPATGQSPGDELSRGIELFEAGQYADAQQVLLAIDRDELADDDLEMRDRYVDEVRLAISLSTKASQDQEQALQALADGDADRAEMFFRAVARNDYASDELKTQAEEGLIRASEKRQLGAALADNGHQAPTQPENPPQQSSTPSSPEPVTPAPDVDPDRGATARALVERGRAALSQGDYVQAADSFEAALSIEPGLPEAVNGLAEANSQATVADQEMSLVDRIRWQRNLLWMRTEAVFRQLDGEVRAAVSANDFDTARMKALRAKQVVESGRANADPVSNYEALRAQAEDLERFVAGQEESWHELDLEQKRDQALAQEGLRRAQIDESRRIRVESLMDQARQFQREKNLEQAIDALEQIEAIDPANERAQWMREDLENTLFLWNQQGFADELYEKQSRAMFTVEQAKMPYYENIRYPKNWPEITARRTPYNLGRFGGTDPSTGVLRRLSAVTPRVSMDGTAFADALEQLRELGQFNMHVNWRELESAGIRRDTPITTELLDVKLEKALKLVLADASTPDSPLGYEVDDGVLTVSTQEELDQRTVTRVYDIRDLVVHVPNFDDAPSVRLKAPRQQPEEEQSESLFADEKEQSLFPSDPNGSVIEKILDIIRDTIYPGTWRHQNGLIGSIRELNGQIIVTHTLNAQQQLTSLLDQLRETRMIQVAVEARFLLVRTNFLEEIGMDLDIILNAGNAGFDQGIIGDANGIPQTAIDPSTGAVLLVPRQFSRLGFLPTIPGLGQQFQNQVIPNQPYGQPALVPRTGSIAPHSGRWSPIPILSNVLGFSDPRNIQTGVPGSFAGSAFSNPALQIFGSFLDNIQVDFLLKATQADGRSTFLDAPRMTLSNGQRGYVAIVTQQAYISALNAVVAQEVGQVEPVITTLNTGTVLDVEATVGADRRYVTLTMRVGRAILEELVDVQVQSTGTSTRGVGAVVQLPRIQVSLIRTTVTVPEGGTVMLGGLKQTGEVELEGGVPILSKIPVLKRAYNSRSMAKDEALLLILVKPSILIQEEEEEEAFPAFSKR